MPSDGRTPDFETFQELSRAFWENWMETGLKAFEEGAESASRAWGEAAEAWHAWLPHQDMPAGPGQVMESLAQQGKAFLELGESMAQAGGNGDWSEWLDRWLDSFSGANAPTAGAFGLPGDAFKDMHAPGGAIDPSRLLSMPGLGFTREHDEARQRLVKAQVEFQQANSLYNSLIEKSLRMAAGRMRDKLAEAEQPGRQVNSLRELYDLWVDAAEEAYADVAFSREFRAAYGELVNSLMRLRRAWLEVTEPGLKMAGIATRSELDDTTRQMHEMRRELAALKRRLAGESAGKQPARKKAAKKKAATKKAIAKKAGTEKASKKKAAKKKATKKKAATKKSSARSRG